jgi:hypothetical protein
MSSYIGGHTKIFISDKGKSQIWQRRRRIDQRESDGMRRRQALLIAPRAVLTRNADLSSQCALSLSAAIN